MNIRFHRTLSISADEQTNFLASVLVFLLCVSISTRFMIDMPLMEMARYVSMISCAVFSLFVYKYVSSMTVSLFLCAAITGMLNLLCIGNSAYSNFLYTLMSIFVACLLAHPRVSPRCLLYAMYFHALMVAYCFARYGLHTEVYFRSTNNYVSCLLLLPTTVYYSLLEYRGERIPKFPALIVFVLSVLAMGRGGILSTGILLTGVLFYSLKNFRPVYRVFVSMLMVISAVVVVHISSFWEIANKFERLGMSDNGRFDIWTQYLDSAFTNHLYFWLGARFKDLPIVIFYEGNLHNSFLNIHAFNGMIMFIFIVCLYFHTIFYAIRHKRVILLTCMISLFCRGATDRLLWGASTVGTPFMLFFLIIPYVDWRYQARWCRRQSKNCWKIALQIPFRTGKSHSKIGTCEGISYET